MRQMGIEAICRWPNTSKSGYIAVNSRDTPQGRGTAFFRKSPAISLNRGVKDIFIACVDGLKHGVLPFILRMKVAQGRVDRP